MNLLQHYDSTFSITSFNNGVNWTSPVFISPFGAYPFTLRDAHGKIIAYNIDSGPYVSYDFGLAWTPFNIPNAIFIDLIFSGNYMFLTEINASGTNRYYYISRIDSISFTLVDSLNFAGRKVIVDSVLFGSHVNLPGFYDIVKSTDFGQTWNTIAVTDSFQNFILGEVIFAYLPINYFL